MDRIDALALLLLSLATPWISGCQQHSSTKSASSDSVATPVRPPRTPKIRIGQNVHVSSAHGNRAHFELSLAAHPTKPDVLLGAGMVWSPSENRYEIIAYRSDDGGQTWSPTIEVARAGNIQDPALAFGPAGWAYFGEWGSGKLMLHRSPDGGSTWTNPVELPTMDRPWISVGPAGSEYAGRVYVPGNGGSRPADLAVVRADDHGRSLRSRTELDVASGNRRMLIPGNSVTLSDGTLIFPYLIRIGEIGRYEAQTYRPRTERDHNAELMVAVSSDGGETFETGRRVSRWFHRFGRGRTATVPALAADTTTGLFQGRVYAAWTDFRSGKGEILLSHSDDRGQHWTDPIVVNRSGGPAFRPELAVNTDGVLGISWYDRRDSASGLGWSARFAASVDGGTTVSRSVRVSEGAFKYSWERDLVVMSRVRHRQDDEGRVMLHSFNNNGGHTAGLASGADGTFYPFWVDNRTGVPQIWTAPVDVPGAAVRHGSTALADRRDVTSKTALSIDETLFDPSTQTVTLTARLRNVSERTIKTPLSLRILDLWSEFGTVRMVGNQQPMRGHGALLDVTAKIPGGELPPDSATAPFVIRAQIDSLRTPERLKPPPPTRGIHGGYGLLRVRTQSLAAGSGENT